MQVKAQLNDARITPRKARLVREIIIGLPVNEALSQLSFDRTKAAAITLKLLKSAIANAEHNEDFSVGNMKVKDVIVNEGFKLKRFQPVSRGMAHGFVKRNSKITVVVEEIKPTVKKSKKKKADIKTLSLEEVGDEPTGERIKDVEKESGEKVSSSAGKVKGGDKEEKVFQKVKMQQQGGDRKKAFRRKSI